MALYCEEHCGTRVGLSTIPVSCPQCIKLSLQEENKRLREALAPFAGAAHVWDDYGGSLSIVCAGNGTPAVELSVARFREALVIEGEPIYPCDKCGKLRTKAEGGTVFTVCDECWESGSEE